MDYVKPTKTGLMQRPDAQDLAEKVKHLEIANLSLVDACYEILTTVKEPIHITTLCGALLIKGLDVKGVTIRNEQRNVRIEPWDVLASMLRKEKERFGLVIPHVVCAVEVKPPVFGEKKKDEESGF